MAMQGTGVFIEGYPELRRKFRVISDKMQRSALRGAVRHAAVPVMKEASRLAPRDVSYGQVHLGDALAISVSVKGSDEAIAAVGVKRRQPGAPAKAAHLQEFGTAHHPAQPFLRPALENKKGDAISRFAEGLKKQITRLAIRAGV